MCIYYYNNSMEKKEHTHAHGPNREKEKMMLKKYVSHYSNKNGQFILRNVQILSIIYITFLAFAVFHSSYPTSV